jgi:hypothetical protein
MDYKIAAEQGEGKKRQGKKSQKRSLPDTAGGVSESSVFPPDRNVEQLLTDIISRLERIEAKIDENVYPPESEIKPDLIKQLKKAEADIRKGKGKTYESMDAFIRAISE